MLPEGSIARSLPFKTSIGADDSVRVRSVRRVPVIMTSSVGAAVAPRCAGRLLLGQGDIRSGRKRRRSQNDPQELHSRTPLVVFEPCFCDRRTEAVRPVGSSYPNAHVPKAHGVSPRGPTPRGLWIFYGIFTTLLHQSLNALRRTYHPWTRVYPGVSGHSGQRQGRLRGFCHVTGCAEWRSFFATFRPGRSRPAGSRNCCLQGALPRGFCPFTEPAGKRGFSATDRAGWFATRHAQQLRRSRPTGSRNCDLQGALRAPTAHELLHVYDFH